MDVVGIIYKRWSFRRVAKWGGGGGGELGGGGGLPPAQLKQVQFVLNIKHAFFDAMS